MATTLYWSAFVDKAYGEAYRPHSSSDFDKLLRYMVALYKKMHLKGDVIVISTSRISEGGGFQSFWNSKAGSKDLIGYFEMDGKPQFYNKKGERRHIMIDGVKYF